MKLTAKLVVTMSVLSMFVLGATLGLLYYTERRHLLDQMDRDQLVAIEKLAGVCADSTLDDNDLSRLAYLKTLWSSSEPGMLSYVVFIDTASRVLMHSDFLRDDLSTYRTVSQDPVLRKASKFPGALRQEVVSGGKSLSALALPAKVRDRRVGTALIAYDREIMEGAVRRVQRDSLMRFAQATFFGLALSLLFAFLFAKTLVRPILALGAGARKIGKGELDYRLTIDGRDELGELAVEFNAMAQRLAELDKLKDSFLAQITHDLRNPLSGILGYAELMLMGVQGELSEKQAHSMQIIAKSANYLADLINNILDLTKLEAGRMEFVKQPVALRECAEKAVELMKVKADEFGVLLECGKIPANAVVSADEQALKRVLFNLVSNSLKFTPKGGTVSIEWGLTKEGADFVAVRDTGIGIPKEKLHTLFQKFSQIAETKNVVRESKGTGLGLVISKEIVEGHGGRIWVESVYQKGTSFLFTLPKQAATTAKEDGGAH